MLSTAEFPFLRLSTVIPRILSPAVSRLGVILSATAEFLPNNIKDSLSPAVSRLGAILPATAEFLPNNMKDSVAGSFASGRDSVDGGIPSIK